MKVALAGEALIDFASVGDLLFQGYPGGSPLNAAVAIARLGQATGYITQLSTDLFGVRLRRHLESNGVDTRFVLSHPAPSTLAFVEHGPNTNRYQFLASGSADGLYEPEPLPVLPTETAYLHFGSVSVLVEPAATTITRLVVGHRDRVTIVFDPNVRPTLIGDVEAYRRRFEHWVAATHILKLSDDDAAFLAPGVEIERAAATWLAKGPRAVVVTSGRHGVTLYRPGDQVVHVPAFDVPVADTIGAGDTLTAGVTVGLLERGVETPDGVAALHADEWRDVLGFATAAAAINCTRPGADAPTRSEVGAFLEANATIAEGV